MGRILDPRYVQHLSSEQTLSLHDVILLDKVQKGAEIAKEEARALRARSLVEGRYPKIYVSSKVAALSKQKAKYLHHRGLDEEHYAELVLTHIRTFGAITRPEADDLLFSKLPDILNAQQKKNKIHRILSVVLKGWIKNTGSRARPRYVLIVSTALEERK
jgi:ATP-dependent DNA helicase RecG